MKYKSLIPLLITSLLMISSCTTTPIDTSSLENQSVPQTSQEESGSEDISLSDSQIGKIVASEFDPQTAVELEVGDFIVLIPPDWEVSVSQNDLMTTYSIYVGKDLFQFQTHNIDVAFESGMDISDVGQPFVEEIDSGFSDGGVDQSEATKINGLDALFFTASGTLSGIPDNEYFFTGSLILHDHSVLVFLLANTTTSQYDHSEDYINILNTIEFNTQKFSTTTSDESSSSTEESIPSEYRSALKKAEFYSDTLHMSKIGIYNQLISEYGESFSTEAAQYAIDNLDVDYKENALEKATSYASNMHMSKAGVYNQLISEYGENFTEEEAQYAIENVQADWNANALEKAKSYQEMNMSPSEIWNQLVSEYGEGFTQEEANYAIENLPQ